MVDAICRDIYRGEVLSLQALDRDGVREAVPQERHLVISITDPSFTHPILPVSGFRHAVLRLHFSDVNERVARLPLASPHIVAFTPLTAQRIAAFVEEGVAQGVRLVIVNCEAGMSRSTGVATALSRFYNHDETFFLAHYRPNAWVRRLTLDAMRGRETVPR